MHQPWYLIVSEDTTESDTSSDPDETDATTAGEPSQPPADTTLADEPQLTREEEINAETLATGQCVDSMVINRVADVLKGILRSDVLVLSPEHFATDGPCPNGKCVFPFHLPAKESKDRAVDTTQNGHWTLLEMTPEQSEVNFVLRDSSPPVSEDGRLNREAAVKELLHTLERSPDWTTAVRVGTVEYDDSVKQDPFSNDCGIFVLRFLARAMGAPAEVVALLSRSTVRELYLNGAKGDFAGVLAAHAKGGA